MSARSQQELAREGGPVERARAEDLGRHRCIFSPHAGPHGPSGGRRVTTREVDTPQGPARAHLHLAGRAGGRAGARSRRRRRGGGAGPGGGDRGGARGRGQRRARRAALPRRRAALSGPGAPARRRLDGGGRAPARAGAPRACRWSSAAARRARGWPAAPPRRPAPWACSAWRSRSSRLRAGPAPAPSRLPELDAVRVPILVVQGERDPFGIPPAAAGRTVVLVRGRPRPEDGPRARSAAAVGAWLRGACLGHG